MIKYDKNTKANAKLPPKPLQKTGSQERTPKPLSSPLNGALQSKVSEKRLRSPQQKLKTPLETTVKAVPKKIEKKQENTQLKSPRVVSKIPINESQKRLKSPTSIKPQAIDGRLTIKQITKVEEGPNKIKEQELKKSEFKVESKQITTGASVSKFENNKTKVKFESKPIIAKKVIPKIAIAENMPQTKHIIEKQIEKINVETTDLFEHKEENYFSDQNNNLKASFNQTTTKSNKMNRESIIIRQSKEIDSTERNILIISADDHIQFHRQSMSSLNEDMDEMMPFEQPLKLRATNDHDDYRFSVRQIQFNLLSSLEGPQLNRESFISRASNKLSKNNNTESKSSIITKRPKDYSQYSQCSQRCSKGLQNFINCLYAGNERTKQENNSVYSDGKQPMRLVFNQQRSETFYVQPNQVRNSSIYIKTEENWDDTEECDDESQVQRYNINTMACQPGSRIAQQVFIVNSNEQQLQQQVLKKENKLDQFVTKVPQSVFQQQSSLESQEFNVNLSQPTSSQQTKNEDIATTTSNGIVVPQDHHKVHFLQTLQALHNIMNNITMPTDKEIEHKKVNLPLITNTNKTKTLIFDMDETLIHCVDDVDNDNPEVIIPIMFPDEVEAVNAGVNIRPYIYECLEEANKYFQVGVFTASHKAYADAILDHIDPENKYFAFRLYRDNCVQTKEGYYVKDLRIFQNRSLKDIVIIDNSVYSFAFHIDNGIPIIPFYSDKEDEEMLHLIYYLTCLHEAEDVRDQNKEAFELSKLASQSLMDIINQQQQSLGTNTAGGGDEDGFEEEFRDGDIREETEEDEQFEQKSMNF